MKKLIVRTLMALAATFGGTYLVYARRLDERMLKLGEPYFRKFMGQA